MLDKEELIYNYINGQLREAGCPVRIINGMPDHVHLLFLQNPQKSISEIVKQISNLSINEPKIYKVRKFACKSLKGKGVQSGIRIIYSYFIEEDKIEFVEIYYKGDKENENRSRIKKLYK